MIHSLTGVLKTTGTDIDKLSVASRFGGGADRTERKETIIQRLQKFFKK